MKELVQINSGQKQGRVERCKPEDLTVAAGMLCSFLTRLLNLHVHTETFCLKF